MVARKNQTRTQEQAAVQLKRVTVAKNPARTAMKPAPTADVLLHEVQVHQSELKRQIKELLRIQAALEDSRDQYIDFYDYAPVGYLTLDDMGVITEINLTGAALLGAERDKMIRQRLEHFVAPEDHERCDVSGQRCRVKCGQIFRYAFADQIRMIISAVRILRSSHTPIA